MFAVVYSFNVIPGEEEKFIQNWKVLTEMIYEFEGSYGSRLHKENDSNYLAYALWPDKETWENSGTHLPPRAAKVRAQMKAACKNIDTLHAMQITEDLLKDRPSGL